jgi:hypothetical protein
MMRFKNMNNHREPIYDDTALYSHKQQEVAELVKALAEYAKTLEEMVVELRSQVNALTPAGQSEPFPDLHENIYEAFDDFPAYQKFKKCLKILD